MNPYLDIFQSALPRLINMFNLDPMSKTLGYGDRLYAGWKTADFPNGTFQGGMHALAIAHKLDLLPDPEWVYEMMDLSMKALHQIVAKNGSLSEAYPRENSFCVTALVAFDLLSAIDLLFSDMSHPTVRSYFEVIERLIQFISDHDEEHAIISNHLATGVAAVALWNRMSGHSNDRWKSLLDIILSHQSKDGYFLEYESADPGYESLSLHYFSVAQRELESKDIGQSISRSLSFLKFYIHPDGSIGGTYGSRNTEVMYPGGMCLLSTDYPDAHSIIEGLTTGLNRGVHITPVSIDANNFIPLMNSYGLAALHYSGSDTALSQEDALPWTKDFVRNWTDAGIYIHSCKKYYAIVNYKKGGVIKVFDKLTKTLDLEDSGLVGRLQNGRAFSTQMHTPGADFTDNTISPNFYLMNEAYPGPLKFIIIRALSLTFFRSVHVGNIFKKQVVKLLMTGKNHLGGKADRKFIFTENKILIEEKIQAPLKAKQCGHVGKFKAIHMASSGYNSSHMLSKNPSQLVEFIRSE